MGDGVISMIKEPWIKRGVGYAAAALIVALCTLVSGLSHWWDLDVANLVMIFLAGVALTAAKFGRGPALAAIALSVLSYDYFFVPPVFAFAMVEGQYVITLVVMTAIGLLISDLTSRLQAQLRASRAQERRAMQLYRMSREFGQATGMTALLASAGNVAADAFDGETAIYVRDPTGGLGVRFGAGGALANDPDSLTTARWVAEQGRIAGRGSGDLPAIAALFAPMAGLHGTIGVLAVRPRQTDRFDDEEERRTLETFANLLALTLERDQSIFEANAAQSHVAREKLRNTLLTSISHDLRSPLATIVVTATELLEGPAEERPEIRREVLKTIVDETRQLARQVDNLLDMGRLNSSEGPIACDWQVLEELMGVALGRLRRELAGHTVRIDIPADFPMLWAAGDLLGQVLLNLLENAARYTPAGSCITIGARRSGGWARVTIADDGPGLAPGSETTVFDKFVRGATKAPDGRRGLGLGLAICRSIVRAHGGEITAANRAEGGAEFAMLLPCQTGGAPFTLDGAAARRM